MGKSFNASPLHLFTEADFCGDALSQRSTSGVHLDLRGTHSQYPLQSLSAKQDVIAVSAPEAGWYAGCTGYRKEMMLACGLCELLGPSMRTPMFHEDNLAMLMVVLSGRNPTMRHLGRVHRVCVRWLHERLGNHPGRVRCILFYEDAADMSAEVYTKAFATEAFLQHAIRLINVFDPSWITPEYIASWLDERAAICFAPEVLRTKEVVHQKFSKAARQREGIERVAARKAARTSDVAPSVLAIAASASAASSSSPSASSTPRPCPGWMCIASEGPNCFVQWDLDSCSSSAKKVIMFTVQQSFYCKFQKVSDSAVLEIQGMPVEAITSERRFVMALKDLL